MTPTVFLPAFIGFRKLLRRNERSNERIARRSTCLDSISGQISGPSFVRRQPTNSGARSEIVMPSDTMNLQLRMGRAESSSDNWQFTRQYWHSWFQQNRP